MICPKCKRSDKMVALFTSMVCDRCDPPKGVKPGGMTVRMSAYVEAHTQIHNRSLVLVSGHLLPEGTKVRLAAVEGEVETCGRYTMFVVTCVPSNFSGPTLMSWEKSAVPVGKELLP